MDTLEAFHQNVDRELIHARQSVHRNQGMPVHRARRDRQHSIQQMNFNIMEDRRTRSPSDTQIRFAKTIVTGQCHSSTTPLNELKPMTLSQMKVPMVHTGRYLACRSVTEQYVIVATAVLIEDLNGEVEDLSLYNFE
uniref:Uncharacterized protein n=1 Tax=Ditylenchus dipsaci TaxID=166011 RepID=A0A915EGQ0_9BILA